ncbi:MAG: hypothetical protein JST48_06765 [Bacteroidetes bacterium]|nr:hypothetical protein [Bacteroidota bacterium]
MERNEIKLRRKLLDEATLQRHRNYSLLLKQHQIGRRKKRVRRFFIFTLLVAVITVLILIWFSYFAVKLERERKPSKKEGTSLNSKKNNIQTCYFSPLMAL